MRSRPIDLTTDTMNRNWTLALASVLLVVLLSVVGYFGSGAFESLRELAEQQVRMATIQSGQTETLATLTNAVSTLQSEVRDNDRRISRREDNQFTARDAARLQGIVSTNSALINKSQERIAQLVDLNSKHRLADRKEVASLRAAIRKLYELLAEADE